MRLLPLPPKRKFCVKISLNQEHAKVRISRSVFHRLSSEVLPFYTRTVIPLHWVKI